LLIAHSRFRYSVDVVEFVGGEHTPRNALIRAVYTGAAAGKPLWEEYDEMARQWGVVPWLAEELAEELRQKRPPRCRAPPEA
jgi:hypothetical protein